MCWLSPSPTCNPIPNAMCPCPGKQDTPKESSRTGVKARRRNIQERKKINECWQKALSTGCFFSHSASVRGIWRLHATVPPRVDTNTSKVGQGVRSLLIQAAMTQWKQFIQSTFLAHNWTPGEKGVRSRPRFSGGSADGELVRELSRESHPLGTSHSPVADLLHYSFHNLCSNFLLLLTK